MGDGGARVYLQVVTPGSALATLAVEPLTLGLVLFVVGFLVAFLASTVVLDRRSPRSPAAAPELPVVLEGRERQALAVNLEREMEEAEPMVERAPEELPDESNGNEMAVPSSGDAEKVAKLRAAYASGRVTRAAYEANLVRLGRDPDFEPEVIVVTPPPTPPTTPDERLAKLRAALAAGRITRDVYERNVRALERAGALGAEVKTDVVLPPPMASGEDRVERLHRAYREGRLPRELYEKNIRALGGEPMIAPVTQAVPSDDEKLARIRAAFRAGRIPRDVYERNVRALGGVPEPMPAPPPTAAPAPATNAEKIAKLRAAYESGRLTKDAYLANLAKLRNAPAPVPDATAVNDPPPPPPAPAPDPVPEPDIPVLNPEPPSLAATRAPPDFAERIALLKSMYTNGRISRGVFESNLARAYEPMDPRLAQLRRASEEGRMSKDAYDANVRRVLQERGAP